MAYYKIIHIIQVQEINIIFATYVLDVSSYHLCMVIAPYFKDKGIVVSHRINRSLLNRILQRE